MSTLNTVDSLAPNDRVVVFVADSSPPYESATITTLAEAIEPLLTSPQSFSTQYAAPAVNGFSISIVAGSLGQTSIRLILTPTAGFAQGTIVLPLASLCVDGQMVQVICTRDVTTLIISTNGAVSVVGAPTGLAPNGFFTLAFDLTTLNWYRVS